MNAEEVNKKIFKLEHINNLLIDWAWNDEIDEDFGQRWNKKIRQYRINVLESYAKQCLSDAEKKQREEILRLGESWSLPDIVAKLTEAAKILLHKKDYDGHGWEGIELCVKIADEWYDTFIKEGNNQ